MSGIQHLPSSSFSKTLATLDSLIQIMCRLSPVHTFFSHLSGHAWCHVSSFCPLTIFSSTSPWLNLPVLLLWAGGALFAHMYEGVNSVILAIKSLPSPHRSLLLQNHPDLLHPILFCLLPNLCLPDLRALVYPTKSLPGVHGNTLHQLSSVHLIHHQMENCGQQQ